MNKPAFPSIKSLLKQTKGESQTVQIYEGMTDLTYIATRAMEAYIGLLKDETYIDPEVIAQNAYAIAEAMKAQEDKIEKEFLYEKAKKQK